jgi:hypothetical protein
MSGIAVSQNSRNTPEHSSLGEKWLVMRKIILYAQKQLKIQEWSGIQTNPTPAIVKGPIIIIVIISLKTSNQITYQ